jgi:hypothetical protein
MEGLEFPAVYLIDGSYCILEELFDGLFWSFPAAAARDES